MNCAAKRHELETRNYSPMINNGHSRLISHWVRFRFLACRNYPRGCPFKQSELKSFREHKRNCSLDSAVNVAEFISLHTRKYFLHPLNFIFRENNNNDDVVVIHL